ncbi:MAG: transposase [Gammaproteobacteria bacterium]|nr:transposase [Gammaproteobacteria bacterium]
MAYLGLVPSEHSSGGSRRQGSITRTGNGHVRRVLTEAAWNYSLPGAHRRGASSDGPSKPRRRCRPLPGRRRNACAGATRP